MAFAARFSEAGESEIIDNLFAVTHRDMKAALDLFYAADNLPAFASTVLGDFSVFQFPLLVIDPDRMSSTESESGEWLDQTLDIGAGLAVKDASINGVTKKAIQYVRAFKAVLRAATTADLFGDAVAQLFDHSIDIDHRYQKRRSVSTDYVQPVEFTLRFKFGEK